MGFRPLPFALAGMAAFILAVIRAAVQSITQDEADTYFWFASKAIREIWHPFPNNHILNTLLMWFSTRVFGLSSISLRMPALLGAALYIGVCYLLCRRLKLQLPIFICLVYNPFILDFMVAARGYSLANAFLLAAIAIPVLGYPRALASLALGLSFAASFSYVFVDIAAFIALLTWALWQRKDESAVRIAASCVLPGFIVALMLCGPPLMHWPKGELLFGAHSLGEMMQSLIDASFYQLNPRNIPVELYDTLDFVQPMLWPVLAILCVWQSVTTRIRFGWFAAGLAGIITLSVAMSWLAFRFYQLPLPMSRTGIFLITLCTLLAGVIASGGSRAIQGVLICMACYFLLCLRVSYFKEYQDGAENKRVYAVLARLNHTYGVTDTAMDGLYVAPLNFYRVLSRKETFPEFEYVPFQGLPLGKSIYVLHEAAEKAFIVSEHLLVVYRGPLSGVVVATRGLH